MSSEKLILPTSGCSRCERLPDPLPESGYLYLAPPMIHTSQEFIGTFEQMKLEYAEPHEGIFCVHFKKSELGRLCDEFMSKANALELHDTKALVLTENEQISAHHLTQMEPLESIVAKNHGEWLFGILSDNRIHSFFHPIVAANNPQSIYAYECLARGTSEDGKEIPPGKMFAIARQTDMLFNLDRACRLAAINGCVEHGLAKTIFVNFTPGTIYDPKHCLQTTMQAIMQAGLSPEQVVFEVVESEEVANTDHLLGILDYYRDNGFRVALDDLGAGFSSLNLLANLKPDFIKLDMGLIRDVDSDPYKSVITGNIIEMSRRLGIKTIAEGVETVKEWQWLRNKGIDYVQGFLFAKPAAPPMPIRIPES